MGQLLTANVATNLYWLGRYIERIEATLLQIVTAYDCIIDVDKQAGVKLYKSIGVDLEYKNAQEFLSQSILGDHAANLNVLMGYARENTIISRNYIDQEAFGEIIALHALFQGISKSHMSIDYNFIDNAQSLICEIWGQISKRELRKNSDYFLRLGKLVEEADFHFRFDKDKELAMIIVDEIHAIIDILSTDAQSQSQSQKQSENTENIMDSIHKKIEGIIVI
ncbi:MAG: alpha-E domain-containing protein [Campylobacterales bacterium]|nr:alpha-E domain-containing protein [Campylobacterales bacterium]